MSGSPWTAFFVLLLVEAALVAILVAIVARRWSAARRAASLVASGVVAAPLAVVLHNILSQLIGGEEAVTFLIALIFAPLAVVTGTLAVAGRLRTVDRELAVGLGLSGLGLALFPLYAVLVIIAGPLLRATETSQAALEAIVLPMCLLVTALGIAYSGIVLVRPRAMFS